MNFIDLIRLSFRQIMRYRRRYYGVVLAIALGIAGLQTVLLVSRDFKKNLNRDLTLIGGVTILKAYFDNQLSRRAMEDPWGSTENPGSPAQPPGGGGGEHIAFRAGRISLGQSPIFYFPVIAMDEAFWQVRGFWATSGRLFGREAVTGRKRECVLGAALAEKIFGHSNIAGLTVEIYNEPYRVTGVLGGIIDSDLADPPIYPLPPCKTAFQVGM